ncbi:hypothetical protein K443DRAFT_378613 [Laccaria amethystina LaAM-08-1]|uniref:Uncharacterized protein n=1 Tax=Laccaria amethystina LaAM-08-1 TaxID=1095629 RepID=A0A0C9XIY1_9AGAR|nr:hypothetical protein K443DRAFT_378613 [Laccaria amethystina LaAM-08-1]
MQQQIDELISEGEKTKRSRVAAVTLAAKQMVLDGRKERLLEEFVKDLMQELNESKLVVGKMKGAHEHEILELTWEWSREYRKPGREVERLKLARGQVSLSRTFRMIWRGGWLLAGLTMMWKSWRRCHPRLVSNSTHHHPPAPRHRLVESRRRGPTAGVRWPLRFPSCSILQASLPCCLSENSIRAHMLGSLLIPYSSATPSPP